jgi:nitrilase
MHGLAKWGSREAKSAWLRLWQNSVEIGDESTTRLCQAAQENCVTVAMGLNERVADTRTLYNTILFIGPDGAILGKHRKLVPTNHERMVHGFGDGSTLKVFDTPAGKIGGLICWENWMPLARYALYSQGEQIHVAPTAFDDEIAVVNARNTAFEGGVFVIPSASSCARQASRQISSSRRSFQQPANTPTRAVAALSRLTGGCSPVPSGMRRLSFTLTSI